MSSNIGASSLFRWLRINCWLVNPIHNNLTALDFKIHCLASITTIELFELHIPCIQSSKKIDKYPKDMCEWINMFNHVSWLNPIKS